LTGKIVSQEQATNRVLDTSAHLHHVLHNFLDRRIFNRHVDSTHGDHKVQAGDDVARILDELVKVGEVVDRVVFL
jgi:hypothetical protein